MRRPLAIPLSDLYQSRALACHTLKTSRACPCSRLAAVRQPAAPGWPPDLWGPCPAVSSRPDRVTGWLPARHTWRRLEEIQQCGSMAADVVQRIAKFISDFNATSTQLSSGTGSLAQVGPAAVWGGSAEGCRCPTRTSLSGGLPAEPPCLSPAADMDARGWGRWRHCAKHAGWLLGRGTAERPGRVETRAFLLHSWQGLWQGPQTARA